MPAFSRRTLITGLCLLGALVPPEASRAAGDPPLGSKRVALSGYDPVSYFSDGHPEKGSAEYSAAFDDATYWFKNAEHRALFVTDPDHYAPQFAGYCAVTLSRGAKQEADPEAWAIADGKLYVFASKQGVPLFQQQTASIIEKAGEAWPELRNRP